MLRGWGVLEWLEPCFALCYAQKTRYAVRSESEESKKAAILSTLRKELTWTHYRLLMRVENANARQYYLNEAADQNWSTRVLERNINTFYYERLLSSQNKQEALKQSGELEKQTPIVKKSH